MKISMKSVFKGIVAAGTAVGAGILALQAKKSVDQDNYELTLAPLGEADATEEAKTEMDTIDVPTAEAEVVNEEETTEE